MRLILLFLSFLLITPAYAVDYCDDANVIFCWEMKANENPVQDSSSNNRDGTHFNSPTYSTDAPSGYSAGSYVLAAADSDYIEYRNDNRFFTGVPMSAVAWRKVASSDSGAYIFGGSEDSGNNYVALWYDNESADDRDEAIYRNTNFRGAYSSQTNIDDGTWHHVAGVWEASAQEIFIDGVSKGTASNSESTICCGSSDWVVSSGGFQDSSPSSYFDGSVTELAMFSDALTSVEINAIMDSGLDGTQGAPAGTALPVLIRTIF